MSERVAILCCVIVGLTFMTCVSFCEFQASLHDPHAEYLAIREILGPGYGQYKPGNRKKKLARHAMTNSLNRGVREPFAWPITESDYRKAVICDLHPAIGTYADEAGAHVHCSEELNGGGYRNGKFVYLKDVSQ